VDGREGASGVKGLIDHGDAAVGFLVSRVPTEDIMRVADAGQLLPAKVGAPSFVVVCPNRGFRCFMTVDN
jgi:uncharacterized protein (DUF1015 family)